MKLGVCVPYRNREEHLKEFLPTLTTFLQNNGIEHSFYFAHQIDDKLFNRGAMKNIAAKLAFEDGCDYIVWHDIDMIPLDDKCDYSFPNENPKHIAVNLSKYNYTLAYEQYFGGAVLFSKEQVEKTNGYSNEYWDWGMEDDDLFWRCYFEGMTTFSNYKKLENRNVANFDGWKSGIDFWGNDELVNILNKNHTISVLFASEQQNEKVPIWLIGDDDKQFIEYPVFVKNGGWNYSMNFNNSRAVTMCLFSKDTSKKVYYNWAKQFENIWSWVTISVDANENKIWFYLNEKSINNTTNNLTSDAIDVVGELRNYNTKTPFSLGYVFDNIPDKMRYFKGKIADVKIFNKSFKPDEIEKIHSDNDSLMCHYDFSKIEENKLFDTVSNLEANMKMVDITNETIEINSIALPYRSNGSYQCLPHINEGFEGGKWAKGETTAKNEKRFVTEMQQKKINYKEDGIAQIKYDLVSKEQIADNAWMINVKL
jgi:hypothetical protein